MKFYITDLNSTDDVLIGEIAAILMDGFREMHPAAYPTAEAAVIEIRETLTPNHLSRVALDEEKGAVAWIGGVSRYDGNVCVACAAEPCRSLRRRAPPFSTAFAAPQIQLSQALHPSSYAKLLRMTIYSFLLTSLPSIALLGPPR